MKMLIVDDEKETVELLMNFFRIKLTGFSIDGAYNGQEALDKFNQNEYDLILTDIDMPLMNGLELIKEIQKSEKKTPIIYVFSGYDKNENERFYCNRFYKKPLLDMKTFIGNVLDDTK